nr:MAG TPA: hypothetical protein [Caudoviricetes sp.]
MHEVTDEFHRPSRKVSFVGRGGRNLYDAPHRKTARGFLYEKSKIKRVITPVQKYKSLKTQER